MKLLTQPQIATLSLSMKPILMNSLKIKTDKKRQGRSSYGSELDQHRTCVCTPGSRLTTETSRIQFYQAFPAEGEVVCLRCTDWSELILAFLTWQLLSDLPLHRFPDVCKFHALTGRPGNRFPFRQSWLRWFSLCWPGKWTSWPCRWSLLSDCRDLHT